MEIQAAVNALIEFETRRLFLRQWRASDREPFAALNADPVVMALGRKSCRSLCPLTSDRAPSWSVSACKWTQRRLSIQGCRTGTRSAHAAITVCPAMIGFRIRSGSVHEAHLDNRRRQRRSDSFTWYQSLFGQPKTAPSHGYFGQIRDSDGTVLLCLHKWGAHDHPSLMSPDEAPPGNGLLLFFRVDDFETALLRARALVSRLDEEPHVNPSTRTKEFSLRDPDGYHVTISAL